MGGNKVYKTREYYAKTLVDSVKRHDLDVGSMESLRKSISFSPPLLHILIQNHKFSVAKQTATIRRLQVVMEQYPRNKRMKVELKELIDKRKKYLTKLRCWDYKRFEWILEKLDLVYKAYPSEYHWVTRRESLTKLTNIHCDTIRDERLAAYRKELESQQIDFLKKKLENLEFIRKEQLECAVPVTVSADEIKEVSVKLKKLIDKSTEQQQNQ